jgi:hypothetical protein
MKYLSKVKASKNVIEAITSLPKDGELKVIYGKDRSGKPKEYKIRAYEAYGNKMSYSIWSGIDGMNIDKIGRTTMKGYSYDMMSQKTTYTFLLYEFKLI